MTQSGDAGGASLHYRAYLPMGISVVIVLAGAFALFPLYWWALRTGIPSIVATPAVTVAVVLTTNVFLVRDVVLSSDGRLTVTGFGQRIDVDVRSLTEIRVSGPARWGFGLVQVRWNGGAFRMWQAMVYLPDPRRRRGTGRLSRNLTEDFRDLVYRLYLINPAVSVRGVRPPAWALPSPMFRPPGAY